MLYFATAAKRTAPVDGMTVPVSVYPHSPAIERNAVAHRAFGCPLCAIQEAVAHRAFGCPLCAIQEAVAHRAFGCPLCAIQEAVAHRAFGCPLCAIQEIDAPVARCS